MKRFLADLIAHIVWRIGDWRARRDTTDKPYDRRHW